MKYNKEEIGKIIRNKRTNSLNWSQEALGKEVGVTGKQISNYEKGILTPPIDVLFKLCELFDCELGYLLGEEDYTSGTKLNTSINNKLGINTNSINAIRNITGNKRSCIHFGYDSNDFIRILNNILSSPYFRSLIESIYELDHCLRESDQVWIDLDNKYGKEVLSKAQEYLNSSIDYYHDDTSEQLSDIYYEAIKDIDNAIDINYETSFKTKVNKYAVYEAFEQLISSLYPTKNN